MGKSLILLALAVGVAACGEEVDERPASFEYIATAILAPSCGTVSCHSETTHIKDFEFDSVEGAWKAWLFIDGSPTPGPGDPPLNPADSPFIGVLRGFPQMPPDSPLPEVDIQLIERWIADGARNN
jgi:hypothetical protein